MASKQDRLKLPPSTTLGQSKMTQAMVVKLEASGVLRKGVSRAPPRGEDSAHPEADEVVVFHDFRCWSSVSSGLRFCEDHGVV